VVNRCVFFVGGTPFCYGGLDVMVGYDRN